MSKINRKDRPSHLITFFHLANKNFKTISESEISPLIFSYSDLIKAFKDEFTYNGLESRSHKMLAKLSSGEEGKEEITALFDNLQKHLNKMLEKILTGKSTTATISVPGKSEMHISQDGDNFESCFTPSEKPGKLDLPSEKALLDIIFISLTTRYSLKPSHFAHCAKDNCKNYFYKYSESSLYCSQKCSNAQSQKAYKVREKAKAKK